MHTSTLLVPLLLLVVCVSATSLQPALAHRVPAVPAPSTIGQGFEKRQVSVAVPSPVPSQCTSTCNLVSNEVSLGCPYTACCTTTFETQYYNCLECVGMALDSSSYATAQNSLNLLYTTCVDMGFVLPQLALPGQPASGSSASASGSVQTSSTGSVSGSVKAPSSAASSGVTPSSSPPATGAAISAKWHGARADALTVAILIGLAGLW